MLEGQGESRDTMENKHQSRQSSVPPKGPANDGRKGEKSFCFDWLSISWLFEEFNCQVSNKTNLGPNNDAVTNTSDLP